MLVLCRLVHFPVVVIDRRAGKARVAGPRVSGLVQLGGWMGFSIKLHLCRRQWWTIQAILVHAIVLTSATTAQTLNYR